MNVKRTEIKDMKPGLALAEQIPLVPEPGIWLNIFAILEERCQRSMAKEDRMTIRALGLSCKCLFGLFLPKEIELVKRDIEVAEKQAALGLRQEEWDSCMTY